ncbi:MAG: putative transcriptional regulatory protein [Chloroflexi bacterium ADurb.Bin180]|jgi:YebC/PmpR family DNA-binding regulatory protein|nr:MAG: putative transcriptional regulatory protein [Chloroflexi bacterium ADurb.Bin180]HNR96807.1 YebC/PmpR family DNA-binding transcriptional regulator [Anaerolineae bacterium]HNT05892.1 YebC/PmpR family DNA-binding transcriptional regulator [Anaerolineae bacterium]HOU22615.1 YebC/PmpR family DNA-binding transcriptional regulator [Anaerolineae bacterium]HQJ52188.1 YebC/PmpR family DNA-binding transcriptional regulator [Anaerolineae bacterium]
MSGHSHWATIKRSKGAADAKRGQLFTKLGRELEIAAREGGGDPNSNFKLRLAVDKAKQAQMPKDNIERAIQRGTGQLKGESLEEIQYEGYGPQGTALIVEVVTDNRNRAASEVRRVFSRHGGNLGSTGSVAWMFERKGTISLQPDDVDAEELALLAIDAGAEDVKVEDDLVEVYTRPEELMKFKETFEQKKIPFESAELAWIPKSLAQLDVKATLANLRLIDSLEELDDVSHVHSNLEISEEAAQAYEAEE